MKSSYLGLRTCIYKVEDIVKAKEWYTKAFEVEPYFDQPFYVGFNIGGFELGLQPSENSVTHRSDNAVAYWGVDNVQKVFKDLIMAGAVIHEKPQNVGGEIVVATVKDPWNNVIGIIYNPEFKIV